MYGICDKDFSDPIGLSCSETSKAGFTGRAVLFKSGAATVTLGSGSVMDVTASAGDKVRIDNTWANALTGTQASLVVDGGRPMFHHDIAFRAPRAAGEAAAQKLAQNIDAIAHNSLMGIFEREDGTYLAVGFFGKMTATAMTQAEDANQGDWAITLGVDESLPEVLLVDDLGTVTNPKSAKQKFEIMYAAAAS